MKRCFKILFLVFKGEAVVGVQWLMAKQEYYIFEECVDYFFGREFLEDAWLGVFRGVVVQSEGFVVADVGFLRRGFGDASIGRRALYGQLDRFARRVYQVGSYIFVAFVVFGRQVADVERFVGEDK